MLDVPPATDRAAVITAADPRYADLLLRRSNERFLPRPESFRIARTAAQVAEVVTEAVRSGRRISVRSGGHCYENFVGDPVPSIVLDLVEMDGVWFDAGRNAFAVEPGATLTTVFRSLYLRWGVTIPGGECGSVAIGGHIAGGGYGPLSRLHGSVVDYLYGVEIVVVDADGRARIVVATREPDDPNRELWWAHTGGGGGNFGVVTKYWLRAPGATGDDPGTLLPRPPGSYLQGFGQWSWGDLDRESFRRLIRNHGDWHTTNSSPGSAYSSLWSVLFVSGGRGPGATTPEISLVARIDGTLPDAASMLRAYLDAVGDGVPGATFVSPTPAPWFATVQSATRALDAEAGRQKIKAAYLRQTFTDTQIDTVYDHLSAVGEDLETVMMWLLSYGGRVNAVDPSATVLAQRDSVLKVQYIASWSAEAADDQHIDWSRRFYRAMYADTGGVPVPGEVNDGSYINYPDVDLADPEWNTSGVPWHDLYYKQNYPRLQAVKAAWDPRDVFQHALSVRPPR